ncbi:MAG TPA: radical SAM protein [Methylomirabilota bacterium]|jgi:hypothetical protein|nr:radical SAM protein [Methylomirabilota bacterium]
MASIVLTDAFVSINAVDYSDHVKQVTLNFSAELQDSTAMGNTSRARKGGLKDWSMDIDFFNDWAAAQIDVNLFPLVGVQTAIKARSSKTAAISATNPEYRGNGIIDSYPPLSDAVGTMATTKVTIKGSDGVALTRNTT